jgi:hypothetical protein
MSTPITVTSDQIVASAPFVAEHFPEAAGYIRESADDGIIVLRHEGGERNTWINVGQGEISTPNTPSMAVADNLARIARDLGGVMLVDGEVVDAHETAPGKGCAGVLLLLVMPCAGLLAYVVIHTTR